MLQFKSVFSLENLHVLCLLPPSFLKSVLKSLLSLHLPKNDEGPTHLKRHTLNIVLTSIFFFFFFLVL